MTLAKKGTHLFIDTNVLLGFFAYSKDDLTQLDKLVNIITTNVVKLYVTQQVVDEFYRNRDAKLAESFEKFRPFGNEGCPSFMTSLPEYAAYKSALHALKIAKTALNEKSRSKADARELQADVLFKKLAALATVIPVDDSAFAAAERRARLGNPPGKSAATIGDQLNWELLLKEVPKGADLHVITKDSDYASRLDSSKPQVFLADEWNLTKHGTLYLHEQISLFFKANYPDEDFSLEIEKQASIEALTGSGSFAATHAAIASLDPYLSFLTTEEAQNIVQGALSNSQVAWIVSDSDVEAFFQRILQLHGKALSAGSLKRLQAALGLEPEEGPDLSKDVFDDEEIPF